MFVKYKPNDIFFIIYAKSKNKSEQRIIKLEGSTLFDVANSYISSKLSLLYISNKLSLLTSCNFFLNIILSTVYVSGKTFGLTLRLHFRIHIGIAFPSLIVL